MRVSLIVLPALALSLAACGSSAPPPVVGPGSGGLTRNYNLVDEQGRVAGRVVISPLGGGQLIDQNGAVIGHFVQP